MSVTVDDQTLNVLVSNCLRRRFLMHHSRTTRLKMVKTHKTLKLLAVNLCLFPALFIWCAPAWCLDDVSSDLETIRVNRNMPGLSAMVIKGGHILAQGATGHRREGSITPLLVTDPINLGSCTKWMTATIAGRLVDRGIIGWNTRVRDLFDNYLTFNTQFYDATLDQLLCHRARGPTGNHI